MRPANGARQPARVACLVTSQTPTWHADDVLTGPALLRDRNDPMAGSAADRRPTMPARPLLHFAFVAGEPWLNLNALPGCRRRCPEPDGRHDRHRRFASAANRFLQCANASWASADRTAQLSADSPMPAPYFLLQSELCPLTNLPRAAGQAVCPGAQLPASWIHPRFWLSLLLTLLPRESPLPLLQRELARVARSSPLSARVDSNPQLSESPEFASPLGAG